MAFENKTLLAWNRGVISRLGLARIDLDRMAMSAETQTNFIPRVLGSMMLRVGTSFIERLNNDANNRGRIIPFSFGVDDQILLEFSPNIMQMRDPSTELLLTRVATSSQTANGNFTTSVPDANWIDASDTGGTVGHDGAGRALIKGDGTDFGIMRQTVTVSGPDQGVEHWFLIRIDDGPVRFKCGSTAGDDDYVTETRLGRGEHNLQFTPTGDFIIEFANEREFNVRITQCTMQTAAADVSVGTPYSGGYTDYQHLRWARVQHPF